VLCGLQPRGLGSQGKTAAAAQDGRGLPSCTAAEQLPQRVQVAAVAEGLMLQQPLSSGACTAAGASTAGSRAGGRTVTAAAGQLLAACQQRAGHTRDPVASCLTSHAC
jgi:hypothetical protein